MPRIAGHTGRLPVKPPADRFPLRYVHEYTATPLPAPTYPVDVSGGITDWRMLGNGPDPTCTTHPNGVGDCTFAGREHLRMAKAASSGVTEQWETTDQLVNEYLKYDRGQDIGANIADLLLTWYQAGAILGFAPVDHTNPVAVDAAMAAFHGVYAGVQLTPNVDELFSEGRPWTVAGGEQPDPRMGHCIVKVGATTTTDTWVTWGALQDSTKEWTAVCLEEAWVIITNEDTPVDLVKLRADIDAFGGHEGGVVPPAPAPHPSVLTGLVAELRALIKRAEHIIHESRILTHRSHPAPLPGAVSFPQQAKEADCAHVRDEGC